MSPAHLPANESRRLAMLQGLDILDTALEDDLLEVPNAVQDPHSARLPTVAGSPRLRLYAGVPLKGDGLSAAQQTRLFQPFNRLGAEKRRVEGTGLGLVIARALTTAMHGELQVSSSPGNNSTFTVSLPAGAPPALPGRCAPPAVAQAGLPVSARKMVLYIEDEPLNQLLMQELFKAQPQWHLEIASDGAGGLARLAESPYHLVLIDMNLPDMNGLTLIRTVRADPATAGLHCIALSADAMQSQIEAALAAGYDAYWTKPIHVARVLEDLSALLNSQP